jgi:hypothetical protein
MTIYAPSPSSGRFDQNQIRTRVPFFADYRLAGLDALSGQVATFARTGARSVPTVLESFAIGANLPALEWTAGGLAYFSRDDAALSYPYPVSVSLPFRVGVSGIRSGATSGTVLRIGGDTATENYFEVRQEGQAYRARFVDGTGAASEATTANVSEGVPFDLIAQVVGNVAQITVRTSGAYASFVSGSSVGAVAAWDGGLIDVGSLGGSGASDTGIYRILAIPGQGTASMPWGFA